MSHNERSEECPDCGYTPCICELDEGDEGFDDDELGIDPEEEEEEDG
jgi:hypothetical protein